MFINTLKLRDSQVTQKFTFFFFFTLSLPSFSNLNRCLMPWLPTIWAAGLICSMRMLLLLILLPLVDAVHVERMVALALDDGAVLSRVLAPIRIARHLKFIPANRAEGIINIPLPSGNS